MENGCIIKNVGRSKMLEENIEKLNLKKDIEEILKENNILKIKQLVNKTKTNLKTIGLLGYQISEIEIKLQLVGYDLKGNH
jgi:DNA-directed RNA polymerase alpha subunit